MTESQIEAAAPEPLTIRDAQLHQPWTVPYSDAVIYSGVEHILASHCCLHAMKSIGKLAAVFESLDHSGLPANQDQRKTIEAMAADLMTAALRFANLYSFDLELVLRERVKEKNGVALPSRKHAVEELPEGVEVAGSFSAWWIVRDVIGGHEYLRRDGKWHCTNCFGANGGYWPTRESAIAFIRKVATESQSPTTKGN